MTGITSSMLEGPAAIRLLSTFIRTYSYERSGFGESDESPSHTPPSSSNIAKELDALLRSANIKPPYIIVCHSYAGITSREFLHLRRENLSDIAGMVFVDANTEETPLIYPNPNVSAVRGELDSLRICIERTHKLRPEEWQALLKEEASVKHQRTADREIEYYKASAPLLLEKGQLREDRPPLLGDSPISVLESNYPQDLQKIYDAGVAEGNGTEEQRAAVREYIANCNEIEGDIQKQILRLSTRHTYEFVPDSGHNIHMERLDIIAKYVKWVLDQVMSRR